MTPSPHLPTAPIHPLFPSSVTGSTSGSASPSTRYGSFPPGRGGVAAADLETRLSGAAPRSDAEAGVRDSKGKGKGTLKPIGGSRDRRRSWGPSSARVLIHKTSRSGRPTILGDDVFDSDADLDDDERRAGGHHDASSEPWSGEESSRDTLLGRRRSRAESQSSARDRRIRAGGFVEGSDVEKQPGVLKMEAMARTWGRKGLVTIYCGVYLISALMSLESNTTPTIEPYFLSLLKAHSLLGAVGIVTNIAHAVGKPPMTKFLDVFGRAEGVALAALLYFLGYMLTACATDVRVFVVARALAALGSQGLQLAQQIIVADTTTLTNRGLITSTISLPWLVTTWIGPPLGSFFQSRGETGYRVAYGLFAVLLPLVAAVLILTLLYEWRKAKRRIRHGVATRRANPGVSRGGVGEVREDALVKGWEEGGFSWRTRTRTVWRNLDVVGLGSLTVGCVLVLLPLTLAAKQPQSWADPTIWVLIAGGGLALAFFAYYELTWSPVPLLPPRLLTNRTILCGSFLGFFHFLSQFVYESFFTSFLQVARGHSPRDASYISESYIFAASIAAIIAGFGAKITKRYRWIGISGVLIHLAGTWLMMRTRNLDSSTFELVLSQMIGGIGGGFTTIAGQIGVQSVVGHQDVAIATTTFLTITQIGGAVGGAAAGAIWSTLLPAHLALHLPADSLSLIPDIMASLPYTLTFPPGSAIRLGINQAYVEVQQKLNLVAIFMLLPALVCAALMKNTDLETEDQGQGEGVVVLGRASFLHDEVTSSETSSLLGGSSD